MLSKTKMHQIQPFINCSAKNHLLNRR